MKTAIIGGHSGVTAYETIKRKLEGQGYEIICEVGVKEASRHCHIPAETELVIAFSTWVSHSCIDHAKPAAKARGALLIIAPHKWVLLRQRLVAAGVWLDGNPGGALESVDNGHSAPAGHCKHCWVLEGRDHIWWCTNRSLGPAEMTEPFTQAEESEVPKREAGQDDDVKYRTPPEPTDSLREATHLLLIEMRDRGVEFVSVSVSGEVEVRRTVVESFTLGFLSEG